MRILITNESLDRMSGTIAYVKDLSIGLRRRGHEVTLYSNLIGQVGRELQQLNIPVVYSLKKVPFIPDLIHGHHTHETTEATLYFPKTPAIYVCHDRVSFHDRPPRLDAIAKYIAVDENCLERILFDENLPREKTVVVYNFVNLERFAPRPPLPVRPQRAVLFSNYAKKENYWPFVQKACDQMGLSLDVIGFGMGRYTQTPETLLGQYDLVFGKAKCALEAMAVGCAVICCDFRGFGGLVTTKKFDLMRRYNFGMKILNHPFDVDAISQEIAKYDAEDAAEVTKRVRKEASLEPFLDQMEEIYRAASSHPRESLSHEKRARALRTIRGQRFLKTMVKKMFTFFPFIRTCYLQGKRIFSSAF